MGNLRVHNFSISLDGFGAGEHQDEEHPLGVSGGELHEWIFRTAHGRTMIGQTGGSTGTDNSLLATGDLGIGASIIGRNMFTPFRGPWDASEPAAAWRGWWGPNPPYHHDVFVLTSHPREPLVMEGGTVFHFVATGLHAALDAATESAGGMDVRLVGGVSVLRDFIGARLVDTVHLAVVPVLLGAGERVFDTDWRAAGYRVVDTVHGEGALHVTFSRKP